MNASAQRRLVRVYTRALRKSAPPTLPVCVRTTSCAGDGYGWCSAFRARGRARLRIVLRLRTETDSGTRSLTDCELLDTLRHEWAHALAFGAASDDDHGPEWGVAYARAYRATLDVA